MANTLTPLIPSVIAAIRDVARGTGAIFNTVDLSLSNSPVGYNGSITLPATQPGSTRAVVPGADPTGADTEIVDNELKLDNWRAADFYLTGEEERSMQANAADFKSKTVAQKVSDLVGYINGNVWSKMYQGAGIALGTAGTNPFASNPDIVMDCWEELAQNKAPGNDHLLTLGTAAWAAAGKLDQFQKLNEAPRGTDFATGQIGMLANMMSQYDQEIGAITKGTGASYVTSGANAVGDTEITLATGTGTILAGDIITIAGDSTQYVVKVGLSAPGNITLNTGLRVATSGGEAVTLQVASVRNLAASRIATRAAIRPDQLPVDGDKALDTTIVSDPVTGLALRLSSYGEYKQIRYEVSAVWGSVVDRPEWVIALLG